MKDIKHIKKHNNYTCDEGVDISQFRKGWDKDKIKMIYEKVKNEQKSTLLPNVKATRGV